MAPQLANAPSVSISHSQPTHQIRGTRNLSFLRFPSEVNTRRDSEILDQVKRALCSVGYDQLKRIRVHCHHGRVTLQGPISTYFLKQVAQETIRTICDIREIVNSLQVVSTSSPHV